ncbi:MAG: hypothetical protein NVSMB64_15480 [Candidatus Velthaea sp.]
MTPDEIAREVQDEVLERARVRTAEDEAKRAIAIVADLTNAQHRRDADRAASNAARDVAREKKAY